MAVSTRSTPLLAAHESRGARLIPFAGFRMPVQYEGVRSEHLAVREHAGMFDVSHMGEIETEGPEAEALLQRLLSNDVSRIDIGGAQYSCLCREDGGVLDDLITYRVDTNRFLTVTNAANRDADFQWFATHARGRDVEVRDVGDSYAMLAVQGPAARNAVADLADGALPARMRTASLRIAAAEALCCGTGYTGEDGVELLVDPSEAERVWDALLDIEVVPAGLAARDTLRLEACFHLYGNDLTTERTPIEAGLGWCCKEETGFVGSDEIAMIRARGPAERLVPFVLPERGIPRPGNVVMRGGAPVGAVTSGTMSPSLGLGVGMAYVPSELAVPDTGLEIDVRGKRRPARVEQKPLYRKEG